MESPTLPMRPKKVTDADEDVDSENDFNWRERVRDDEEEHEMVRIDDLPEYLRSMFHSLTSATLLGSGISNVSEKAITDQISVIPLPRISTLLNWAEQRFHLLLLRHYLTCLLSDIGMCLELILERAKVHEALGYPELAVGDGVVALELCEVVLEEGESELVPLDRSGRTLIQAEEEDADQTENGIDGEKIDEEEAGNQPDEYDARKINKRNRESKDIEKKREILLLKYQCLLVLYRCAIEIGITNQADLWWNMARLTCEMVVWHRLDAHQIWSRVEKDVNNVWTLDSNGQSGNFMKEKTETGKKDKSAFGFSKRLVYPWNDHEPDRMSTESLKEINAKLREAATDLEVKKSVLPALKVTTNNQTNTSNNTITNGTDVVDAPVEEVEWYQLGLYAKNDLDAGSVILTERSVLTGIRPHGEALCDACAAEMEDAPLTNRLHCPGCDIPFCSQECYSAAISKYHCPNEDDEETEEGYPPASTPFCAGLSTGGAAEIHSLGRAESSTTPEWDLFFLLLARTMQMAETQDIHPLDLFEIKYLWGDFQSIPDSPSTRKIPHTLSYSIRHHVELPLQWFETLMLSRTDCTPYSRKWLERYDWWILQTLFAKYRGVADAKQSTWTGKAESAAVHPLWCLANHSCDPTVTWRPGGVRNLTVVEERVWDGGGTSDEGGKWNGIKAGEEIWNHYTDVQEVDLEERRDRLREVLGGECLCKRCVFQEKQAVNNGRVGT